MAVVHVHTSVHDLHHVGNTFLVTEPAYRDHWNYIVNADFVFIRSHKSEPRWEMTKARRSVPNWMPDRRALLAFATIEAFDA